MEENKKRTGEEMATLAAKILGDESSPDMAKKLAASVLSQTHTDNQTGKEMETIASNVLKSDEYDEDTKSLAASILSQSNKER
tara:strand:+ start:187 stop:435 length:249 start_codon:yes stop_codon:yes gene_type:complete